MLRLRRAAAVSSISLDAAARRDHVAQFGNITDDPALRYTQSGAALAGFTVPVSHPSKHNGQWQDVNGGFFRCKEPSSRSR